MSNKLLLISIRPEYADKIFVVRGVYRLSNKSSIMPNVVTTLIEDDLEINKENWGFSYL